MALFAYGLVTAIVGGLNGFPRVIVSGPMFMLTRVPLPRSWAEVASLMFLASGMADGLAAFVVRRLDRERHAPRAEDRFALRASAPFDGNRDEDAGIHGFDASDLNIVTVDVTLGEDFSSHDLRANRAVTSIPMRATRSPSVSQVMDRPVRHELLPPLVLRR